MGAARDGRGHLRTRPGHRRAGPPRRGGDAGPRGEHRRPGRGFPGRVGAVGTADVPGPGDRRRGPWPRGDPDVQRHEPGQRRLHGHPARLHEPGRVHETRRLRRPGPREAADGSHQPPGRGRTGLRRPPRPAARPARQTRRLLDPRDRRRRDRQIVSNEIFRPGPDLRATPGVPLRTETLEDLVAVGFDPAHTDPPAWRRA